MPLEIKRDMQKIVYIQQGLRIARAANNKGSE